jgi:hypothetical protein
MTTATRKKSVRGIKPPGEPLEQDLRAQPGAYVSTPGGMKAYVTGLDLRNPGKVLIDYAAKSMGSDSYPIGLLTLLQPALEPAIEKSCENLLSQKLEIDNSAAVIIAPENCNSFKVGDRVRVIQGAAKDLESHVTKIEPELVHSVSLKIGGRQKPDCLLKIDDPLIEVGDRVSRAKSSWEVRAVSNDGYVTINQATGNTITSARVLYDDLLNNSEPHITCADCLHSRAAKTDDGDELRCELDNFYGTITPDTAAEVHALHCDEYEEVLTHEKIQSIYEAQVIKKGIKIPTTKPSGTIVPSVLVVTERRQKPYRLPEIARHKVLSETAQQLRLEGIKNQWKDGCFCLPNDDAADRVDQLYSKFQAALDNLADYLRQLGHYPRKAKELGAIIVGKGPDGETYKLAKNQPNPLSPTVIQAYDPDRDSFLELSDWIVYPNPTHRRRLIKHTPQMLRIVESVGGKEYESPTAQSGNFLCPDDAAWDRFLVLHGAAETAASAFTGYLKTLGTYSEALRDGRYSSMPSNPAPTPSNSSALAVQATVIDAELMPTEAEQIQELEELEQAITQGIDKRNRADRQIWLAAAQIRDRQLWKLGGYRNFASYCLVRWTWQNSYAQEIATAGETARLLSQSGVPDNCLPTSVAAYRPLKALPPELRASAIDHALENDGKLTAQSLAKAAEAVNLQQIAANPEEALDDPETWKSQEKLQAAGVEFREVEVSRPDISPITAAEIEAIAQEAAKLVWVKLAHRCDQGVLESLDGELIEAIREVMEFQLLEEQE